MYQSPNDHKQYRHLVLANQLRVLLIHDPSTARAAAALSVRAGHFDDPVDRQGMAHFLEHMLFLGTQSYPHPGEFQQFINRHGGSNNAWTGTEHTNYFFEIVPDYLPEGLQRFAGFFTEPLFNPELVDKERQAIDAEYKLKLNDDTRRLYQVHKETVNPAHPFAKFSVGSLDTLADREHASVRDDLLLFYQRYYSADRMCLTILSAHDLDSLEQLAEHCFSAIPCQPASAPETLPPLYREQDLGILIHAKPKKETRKLTLTFGLPNCDQFYRQKPLSFIAHLLGYEGQGSLLSWLKRQGWANTLSAGGGISGSNFKDFSVSLLLTPEGMAQVPEIVSQIFAYLDLIRQQGLQAWRYAEKRSVLDTAFHFQEPSKPLDLVSHLVMNLFLYPPEDLLCGDYLMQTFDEAQIQHFLSQMQPDRCRLTLIAPDLPTDRQAQWYFTPYSVRPLPAEWLAQWRQPQNNPALYLPPENPYLVDNLQPQPLHDDKLYPTLLQDQPGFRLWHYQEPEFRLPKGHIYIAIDSLNAVSSPRHVALTRLCVEMLIDSLTEATYPAELAGIGYNIYAHQGGVTLQLSGFSAKQPLLLQTILHRFRHREFRQERFDTIRQQLLRNWRNVTEEKPISQLFNQLTGLLQPNNPPYNKLLPELEKVTLAELPPFVEQMFSHVHIEMLMFGDWPESQARLLGEMLTTHLLTDSNPGHETRRQLVSIQGRGSLLRQYDCAHHDSALLVYYQSAHYAPRDIALSIFTNHLMSATFFHELRTRQQLGYMLGSGNLPLNRFPGLIFYVQSPVAGPTHLLESIDDFINAFPLVLLELTEQQWQASKQGLLAQINEPDTNLRTRAQRYWVSIGNKDWTFDQRRRIAHAVASLTRAEVIRFIVTQLKPRTADRLILSSHGEAHLNQERLRVEHVITDAGAFQRQSRKLETP